MDTGTGRFRHWAQCAVVVIVQRKKVVLKTAKNFSVQQKLTSARVNRSVSTFAGNILWISNLKSSIT